MLGRVLLVRLVLMEIMIVQLLLELLVILLLVLGPSCAVGSTGSTCAFAAPTAYSGPPTADPAGDAPSTVYSKTG